MFGLPCSNLRVEWIDPADLNPDQNLLSSGHRAGQFNLSEISVWFVDYISLHSVHRNGKGPGSLRLSWTVTPSTSIIEVRPR